MVQARVPIIIGTIPFRNTFEQLMPASRFNQNQTASDVNQISPGSPTSRNNDGLPSYGALAIPLTLESYPDLRKKILYITLSFVLCTPNIFGDA